MNKSHSQTNVTSFHANCHIEVRGGKRDGGVGVGGVLPTFYVPMVLHSIFLGEDNFTLLTNFDVFVKKFIFSVFAAPALHCDLILIPLLHAQ